MADGTVLTVPTSDLVRNQGRESFFYKCVVMECILVGMMQRY